MFVLPSISTVLSYVELLKMRVMFLVAFTAAVSIIVSPGYCDPLGAFLAVLFVAFGGGGAGAINMWYDRDIDAIMSRTINRPLPSNRVSPTGALVFGVIVSLLSVIGIFLVSNILAAFLLLCAILFYVFIYTIWLKRKTVYNIIIGGAVGSFPPLIGEAVVTNNISLLSIVLGLIVFVWNVPHFFSLSLFISEDYAKASIPMMSTVYGDDITKKYILLYGIVLLPLTIFPYWLGVTSLTFLFITCALGVIHIYYVLRVYFAKGCSRLYNKKLFIYSIIYLFLYFLGVALDFVTNV